MQAIITRVIPATDTKPTRIKACCARGKVIVSADSVAGDEVFNSEGTHRRAAYILLRRFWTEDKAQYGTPENLNPWAKPFSTGCLPSGDFVHVFN